MNVNEFISCLKQKPILISSLWIDWLPVWPVVEVEWFRLVTIVPKSIRRRSRDLLIISVVFHLSCRGLAPKGKTVCSDCISFFDLNLLKSMRNILLFTILALQPHYFPIVSKRIPLFSLLQRKLMREGSCFPPVSHYSFKSQKKKE